MFPVGSGSSSEVGRLRQKSTEMNELHNLTHNPQGKQAYDHDAPGGVPSAGEPPLVAVRGEGAPPH